MHKDTQNKRYKSKKKVPQGKTAIKLPKHLEHINKMAAGIDVGSASHFVAVPEGCDEIGVMEFKSFTADLHALANWLEKCGIETIAMESTGVYWIPLYELLESRGFEVKLVDARHVKNVSGRKTDVLDCQWLQQLHTYGLLSGAFRPDYEICVLRSYLRQRNMLIENTASHIQHIQKALDLYDYYHSKIQECDDKIEKELLKFQSQKEVAEEELFKPTRTRRASDKNAPLFNLKAHLIRMTGVDLTAVPGIEAHSGLKIISEIGLDMSRWKTGKQFASWLGLCPGNKVSGGKRLSGKSKRTANRAASVFRMSASSLHRSDSALGAFLRRLKSRLGSPKAITATAHKLAIIIFNMLKNGIEYIETGQNYYEQQYRERLVKSLNIRAKALGFELIEVAAHSSS